MTLAQMNILARITELLKRNSPRACPDCGKDLARVILGEAVLWCRRCKEYKLLERDI